MSNLGAVSFHEGFSTDSYGIKFDIEPYENFKELELDFVKHKYISSDIIDILPEDVLLFLLLTKNNDDLKVIKYYEYDNSIQIYEYKSYLSTYNRLSRNYLI